jgi:hypothetical protein
VCCSRNAALGDAHAEARDLIVEMDNLSERIKDEFIMKADYYVERATAYWAKLS